VSGLKHFGTGTI